MLCGLQLITTLTKSGNTRRRWVKMSSSKNYLDNIAHLRGVMIIFVILGHALSIYVGNYAGHEMVESSVGGGLRAVIYSFHMPIFMAISGFLYYFEVKRAVDKKTMDGYGIFVLKKARRLLIPFVIVLYLWRKPLFFLADTKVYEGLTAAQIVRSYLSVGTTGALWFLYVLFAIFVVQRLFANIIWKSDRTVLVWLFVFASLNVASVYFSGPIQHVMLYNYYFFLGTFIHKYQEKFIANQKKWLILTGIIGLIGTVGLLAMTLSGVLGSLYSMFLATADIIFAVLISNKAKNVAAKVIRPISDWSMGIYLFHEPLIVAVGSKLPEMGGTARIKFFDNRTRFIDINDHITTKNRVTICNG